MTRQIAKARTMKRICLRCDKDFLATGRHNRVCPACTEVNKRFSAGIPEMTTHYEGGRVGKRWSQGNAMVKAILAIVVLAVTFLFIWLVPGCGGSGRAYVEPYDATCELSEMYDLIVFYLPDIQEIDDDYERLIFFKNHLYLAAARGGQSISLPLRAREYQALIEGDRTGACQVMSIMFSGFLQVFGYEFQMIELWSDYYYSDPDLPETHSVVEVFLSGHWEMHDARLNLHFELEGQRLSAEEVQEAFELGWGPQPCFDGSISLPGETIEEWPFPYEVYFESIFYSWESVFF